MPTPLLHAAGFLTALTLLLSPASGVAVQEPSPPPEKTTEAPESPESPESPTEDALPEATELVQRSVEAMGGTRVFEQIKTIRMRLDVSVRGQTSPVQLAFAPPDRLYARSVMERGNGPVEMGRFGDVSWLRLSPLPPRPVPAESLAHIAGLAGLYRIVLDLPVQFEELHTLDQVEYDETPCYRVRLVPKQDPEAEKPIPDSFAFFDVDTARLVAMDTPTKYLPGGRATTVFSEWKQFGDLMLFSRIQSDDMGVSMTRTIASLTFNDVPAGVFDLPPEVLEAVTEGPESLRPAPEPKQPGKLEKQAPPARKDDDT